MKPISHNSTKIHSRFEGLDLKGGLCLWAQKNHVRPRDFARAMGYTPAYAWSLLRGQAPVTIPAIGLFLLTYGAKEARELLLLAGMRGEKDGQANQKNLLSQNKAEENQTR